MTPPLQSIRERLTELNDGEPNYHNNLGTVYRSLGTGDRGARAAIGHARGAETRFARRPWQSRPRRCQQQGQLAPAQRARDTERCKVKSDYPPAPGFNLGNVLAARGRARQGG